MIFMRKIVLGADTQNLHNFITKTLTKIINSKIQEVF